VGYSPWFGVDVAAGAEPMRVQNHTLHWRAFGRISKVNLYYSWNFNCLQVRCACACVVRAARGVCSVWRVQCGVQLVRARTAPAAGADGSAHECWGLLRCSTHQPHTSTRKHTHTHTQGIKVTYGPNPEAAQRIGHEKRLYTQHLRLRAQEGITRVDVKQVGCVL
jgi:hypothetical protein